MLENTASWLAGLTKSQARHSQAQRYLRMVLCVCRQLALLQGRHLSSVGLHGRRAGRHHNLFDERCRESVNNQEGCSLATAAATSTAAGRAAITICVCCVARCTAERAISQLSNESGECACVSVQFSRL